MEQFGAVHKEGMKIFNCLCSFIATHQDRDLTEVKFHYSKLLSNSVKRHNSIDGIFNNLNLVFFKKK